jgi:hypothetical protein
MKLQLQPDLRGLWALTWRSVAFLPLMLGVFVLLLVRALGLFLLPFLGASYFWFGLWRYGFVTFSVWLFVLWSWRHFRLGGHFRNPSSVP